MEVPGIEPGSNGADSGLLRAQSIWRVLDLPASYDYAENAVSATKDVPPTRVARAIGESPHDARRCGDNSRRTRHFSLSGSESDGALVLFGTYSFPPKVYEITVVSRLASPVSTFVVETCHPLDGVNPLFSCCRQNRQEGGCSTRNVATSHEPLHCSESRFSRRDTPQHKRTDRQLCSQ